MLTGLFAHRAEAQGAAQREGVVLRGRDWHGAVCAACFVRCMNVWPQFALARAHASGCALYMGGLWCYSSACWCLFFLLSALLSTGPAWCLV
jgi:hypothetical protein